MIYDVHIFVCTNERSNRASCGEQHGMMLVQKLKEAFGKYEVKAYVRIQRSGCLGICDFGPTVAIYPEGSFYVNVREEDVDELVKVHFVERRKLERLLLLNHPKREK